MIEPTYTPGVGSSEPMRGVINGPMDAAAAERVRGTGTSRRDLLKVAGAGGAGILLSAISGAGWASAAPAERTRVYVLVTDGCRPDEISWWQTPNLHWLRSNGLWYPNARSLPIMETIPNHVMMMTGARPDRTGVPANKIFDHAAGDTRDMDRPSDIKVETIIERLNAKGLTTGTVLSKDYLYGIFGDRATYRWEPKPLMPITNHAPDGYTTDALIAMVEKADPDFVFTNLGDIDRVGHADMTGVTTLGFMRGIALSTTDYQVGRFVKFLQRTGRWESSVVIVLADHSMDWSIATNVQSLTFHMDQDPFLKGRYVWAQNGGANLFYWRGRDADKDEAIRKVMALPAKVPGILSIHRPAELRLGDEAGDLVAYCKAGWRFAEPTILHNPIPGNHGHPVTEPIPFIIGGGSPRVARGVRNDWAQTIDVAPTVGALLGVKELAGGYDGTSRL